MRVELPPDLADRIQKLAAAGGGCPEVDVIRPALDSLEGQEQEARAIQEGIDAANAGEVRPFDEFDREFRAKHGIADTEE